MNFCLGIPENCFYVTKKGTKDSKIDKIFLYIHQLKLSKHKLL